MILTTWMELSEIATIKAHTQSSNVHECNGYGYGRHDAQPLQNIETSWQIFQQALLVGEGRQLTPVFGNVIQRSAVNRLNYSRSKYLGVGIRCRLAIKRHKTFEGTAMVLAYPIHHPDPIGLSFEMF